MGQVFSLKRICKIPGPDCVIGAGRGARHLRTGGSAGGPLAFGVESRVMASAIPSLATDALPRAVRAALPPGGLFAEMQWRVAAEPFMLSPAIAREIESLGRVLVQFYRVANLLYRRSVDGKAAAGIAQWLDHGKPDEFVPVQREPPVERAIPREI